MLSPSEELLAVVVGILQQLNTHTHMHGCVSRAARYPALLAADSAECKCCKISLRSTRGLAGRRVTLKGVLRRVIEFSPRLGLLFFFFLLFLLVSLLVLVSHRWRITALGGFCSRPRWFLRGNTASWSCFWTRLRRWFTAHVAAG